MSPHAYQQAGAFILEYVNWHSFSLRVDKLFIICYMEVMKLEELLGLGLIFMLVVIAGVMFQAVVDISIFGTDTVLPPAENFGLYSN